MQNDHKAVAIGLNHIALEVGDVDEALEFYGRLFRFRLRGRGEDMAFIDLGDQFIALGRSARKHRDGDRHFGLVVDDKRKVRRALETAGADILEGPFLDFRDPWGNRWQIVEYSEIQFMKPDPVLQFMGVGDIEKSEDALEELREKGIAV